MTKYGLLAKRLEIVKNNVLDVTTTVLYIVKRILDIINA